MDDDQPEEHARRLGDGRENIDPAWWAPAFDGIDLGDFEAPEVLTYPLARMLDADELPALQRQVLQVLAKVTSAMLEPGEWLSPFRPVIESSTGRSIVPSDLLPEEIALLARVAPLIGQPALRARAADAAWIYGDRSNCALLDLALDAYRALPLTAEVWFAGGKQSWQRAFEIVRRRGQSTATQDAEMTAALSTAVLGMSAEDRFLLVECAQVLREHSRLTKDVRTTIADHLVKVAADANDPRLSRHLEREAAVWYGRLDHDRANQCTERAGRTYIAEADARLASDPVSGALVEGAHLENAIGVLRTLPRRYREAHRLEELLDDLRRRLSASRERTLESMMKIESDPIDLTEYDTYARNQITGETSTWDVLVKLALLMPAMDAARTHAMAKESIAGSLSRIFSAATYSQDARKVSARPSTLDDADPAVVWAQIVHIVTQHAQLITQGILLPALDVLTFEHFVGLDFLRTLCMDAPYVPQGHSRLWATGLLRGLTGDFGTAVAILVPQLEQAIRMIAKTRGAHTLFVDDQGVESEKGLGPLLDMPEVIALLGDGLVMELKALLIDPQGANLRNTTAHGLLNDARAWSVESVYAWWLCLRVVVLPLWTITNQ